MAPTVTAMHTSWVSRIFPVRSTNQPVATCPPIPESSKTANITPIIA
jgi:hypothetical protein